MATESASAILAERIAQFKQKQQGTESTVRLFEPKEQLIVIKPAISTWEALEQKLKCVINFDGVWKTARELYEQGLGAELETAAEIALAKAKKSPFCMFAAMIGKKNGNWGTVTKQMVQETWEVRRNATKVLEDLKLKAESIKPVLALAWRLKGTILRFLGIANEKGTGIKNPAGIFFALTRKQLATI